MSLLVHEFRHIYRLLNFYTYSRRGVRRSLAAIQLFAVTTLLVSTTIYWAVVVLQLLNNLFSDPDEVFAGKHEDDTSLRAQCIGTAMLTVNVRHPLDCALTLSVVIRAELLADSVISFCCAYGRSS